MDLLCPKCGTALDSEADARPCPGCLTKWPVEGGIPRFVSDDFYWGFTSRDAMADMLAIAETEGWISAVEAYVQSTHPGEAEYYRDYVASEERANWRYLLSLSPDSQVLDIGSGLGAITCALARVAGHVTALDGTLENLKFIGIRSRQEGLGNMTLINHDIARFPHLPFLDDQFDLVAMIGVLEWTGDAQPQVNAIETQKAVLSRVRRILKPRGKLYLAIENRFGLTYLLGKPDEHTGLRFVTPLPRFLSEIYSHITLKKPYRTYTHSFGALRRLLRESGFGDMAFYFPVLHYAKPRYYVSLNSRGPSLFLLDSILRDHPKVGPVGRLVGRLAIRLGSLPVFCPTFAVIAE